MIQAKPGSLVGAHIEISYYTGYVTVKLKQDRTLMPDKVVYETTIYIEKHGEIRIPFIAESGIGVREYIVEAENWKWTMPDSYPPRLKVG